MIKLSEFKGEAVIFKENVHVKDGVSCDVYTFENDKSKDLAVVIVHPGAKTPLQKVLQGDKTIEGFLRGTGMLEIVRANGDEQVFTFPSRDEEDVMVSIGDTMQWSASKGEQLTFYEICTPPYKEGRFLNLE
jgi:mannose-6-phosphate isomerase-like protein (cupin superfamily)